MREHACVWGLLVSTVLATGCMVGESEGTTEIDPNDPTAVRMDETTSIEARGGKRSPPSSCTLAPAITVTPNPVPLGATGITVSGTGFCEDWGVFVNIEGAAHCYEGNYTSNGAVTVQFAYTFSEPGTYTVGAWEALRTDTGGYAVGALRTTTTITVQ